LRSAFGSGIGKENQGNRLGKLAAVPEQKFLCLLPDVGEVLEGGVDFVDQQNDLHGEAGRCSLDGSKGDDRLGLFVVDDGEILLLQTGYRLVGLIGYDDVERDAVRNGAPPWGLIFPQIRPIILDLD
jgi:hypothetical protein